jgi:hypothetical protein
MSKTADDLKGLAAREAGDISTNGTNAPARTGPYAPQNKDKAETFLDLLKVGHSKEAACVGAHLSRRTLYNWLDAHEEFAEAVQDAQYEAEGQVLVELRGAIQRKDDTKALMWLLGKMRPDRYGDKKEVEITAKKADGIPEVIAMIEQTNVMMEDKDDSGDDS